MSAHRSLALALPFLCAVRVVAQTPAGGEFRVNSATTGTQVLARVGAHPSGDFVVAWVTSAAAGYDVNAQRFDATGAPRGGEFRVNTFSVLHVADPAVAPDAWGGFTVVWTHRGDGVSSQDVRGRRYDAAGAAVGGEFTANTYTTDQQGWPAAASTGGGNFVLVWESIQQDGSHLGIFGQRFDGSGRARGTEFAVNATTAGSQGEPSVAADGSGRFVVVWTSLGFDASGSDVFGQRFDAAGSRIGGEFRVNAETTGYQRVPSLTVMPSGEFVVVWRNGQQIEGRRFDASGTPVGGDFLVRTFTALAVFVPSLAAGESGDFTVVWETSDEDGSGDGVGGQRFTAVGVPRGPAFQVNTYTTDRQGHPSVASDASGNLIVAWEGGQQPSFNFDILSQRYGGLLPAALVVDTAGNGVLEPGETVDARPSWHNVNGAALTFAGTLFGLTGPAGATYIITDRTGAYGTVGNGDIQACTDCYGLSVSAPPIRPSLHWDATMSEKIRPEALGQRKLWRLHVGDSFSDVPRSNPYYRFVETLLHHAVTSGCTATEYCAPSAAVREQAAVFVLVAKEGAGYAPPACTTPVFNDVPASSPFCRWVEELARRGVVSGCGGGNYCPTAAVTREQMAVFVLRALDPLLNPPACTTPVFADVPPSSPFCRWIEELARRGVVSGCGGGNYCPAQPVTREQMSVFLGATFGLMLYGP